MKVLPTSVGNVCACVCVCVCVCECVCEYVCVCVCKHAHTVFSELFPKSEWGEPCHFRYHLTWPSLGLSQFHLDCTDERQSSM